MNYLAKFAAANDEQRKSLEEKYGADFDVENVDTFGMNNAEVLCIEQWLDELRPEILALQRGKVPAGLPEDEPCYGATGGGVSYTFTPTSLGVILSVKEAVTGKTLNVTEALDWYFYG